MRQKKHVHVVAHSHWDRAWYWPFERFRVKLVECVKAVIQELRKHPDYCFNFDGQVLMLADYLDVCPEDREYLQECAAAGRIQIGPMYCLSDLYCTGGEALIRNLLIGRKWCVSFGGGYSQTLHMPDTFGITPCVPMIAVGFGMNAITFMRGVAGQVPGLVTMESIQGILPQVPHETRFLHWAAPDGSVIPAIRLREGYANASTQIAMDNTTGKVIPDLYVENLIAAAEKWDAPQHDVVLLMAGVDHQIPWEGQAEAHRAATNSSNFDFRFSTLDRCAQHLQNTEQSGWPVYEGEFHGSGSASILGGTLSSRIYLKQRNAAVEQLLVYQVEPAVALSHLLEPAPSTAQLLSHAWKTLLVTHPHDDICGCSVDAVHRRNESDMEQAMDCADALRRQAIQRILKHYGANRPGDERPSFAAINFQAVPRTGPTRVKFDLEGRVKWGDIQISEHYRIVDDSGHAVPFREISRGASSEHPREVIELEIFSPLRPFMLERFYFEDAPAEHGPAAASEDGEQLAGLCAANAWFSVRLHRNGSFDFTDQETGITHRRLGLFSSQGDIGDSYDFSDIPDEAERVFETNACRLTTRRFPGGLVELAAEGELVLPENTDSRTRTRSDRLVGLPFRVTLLIAPEYRNLEVRMEFTNTAANHRLRWNLPLAIPATESLAGLKFTCAARPAGSRPSGDVAPRIFPEHPADACVAASGLACFSHFPINYEIVSADEDSQSVAPCQRLAITVCRSISHLTNPIQGSTRSGTHAGPHTLAPEARCLGRTFRLAFGLRAFGRDEEDSIFHQALLWRAEAFSGQMDPTVSYPWRNHEIDMPLFLEADSPVIVSAFKIAEDGQGLILRLHNAKPREQFVTLRQSLALEAKPVRCDEEPDSSWTIHRVPEGWRILIPAFGLRSLRLVGQNL